ncbi:hypothetical protein SAMN05444358_11057 [Ruegeria halocynthiae]|uniref:Transmembrane transcriptional regulator (Anti-sigma factor RsiW) n=1 Tax=Ruegeria halocynthiae TaxID=985054 RepID=A0A1H3E4U4_9RHOB|nr:hypothetical protein [Ruegeria halocynthiae]SDX73640.1 hypothetical protein SAMN05444358_11057 [Ruegeria halocynthiae]
MKFSDETLLAYLEGSLDEAQARVIEDAVAEDPTLESHLMALDPYAPVVKQVFEAVPAETPSIDLPVTAAPQSNAGPLRLLAVAASVAVIAVSATFWVTRPKALGWAEQAAIYQSLYSSETIASLDNSPQELDAQFAQAEALLGRSLSRDLLENLPGLDLKRAQVLSFKGKPLVQVVFADARGNPFAFCVIRQGPNAPAKDLNLAVLSGLATATWARDGYGYMLLGGDGQTDLSGELSVLTEAFSG